MNDVKEEDDDGGKFLEMEVLGMLEKGLMWILHVFPRGQHDVLTGDAKLGPNRHHRVQQRLHASFHTAPTEWRVFLSFPFIKRIIWK